MSRQRGFHFIAGFSNALYFKSDLMPLINHLKRKIIYGQGEHANSLIGFEPLTAQLSANRVISQVGVAVIIFSLEGT